MLKKFRLPKDWHISKADRHWGLYHEPDPSLALVIIWLVIYALAAYGVYSLVWG